MPKCSFIKSFIFPLLTLLNLGLTCPPPTAPLVFSEYLEGAGGYNYGVAAADIDGDGFIDLTSQDVNGTPSLSSLFWFKNNGKGAFVRHTIAKREPGWFERHSIVDVDGDGRLDVAIVNNRDGHVLWYRNGGNPSSGPWERFVITSKCPRAYDIAFADVDGDGLSDAAVSSYANNTLVWYKNPGPEGLDWEWTENLVMDNLSESRTVRFADFNGDGRPDLLSSASGHRQNPNEPAEINPDPLLLGNSVAWFENTGGVTGSWIKHVIDTKSMRPIHGMPADIDKDGDPDVVMALGALASNKQTNTQQVVWYENIDGIGSTWVKHVVADGIFQAFEAVAADITGNGNLDIIATTWSTTGGLVWLENPGAPRKTPWKKHTIRQNWGAANQLVAADLDGDGRLDIAATADQGSSTYGIEGANELRWWHNEPVAQ